MQGKIMIVSKKDAKPLGPTMLEPLKPYRVVEVKDGFTEADVHDIVLRFPCKTGGAFILNCTKEMMFFDRSRDGDAAWNQTFRCLRAHDVSSISFAIDFEDKP